MKINYDKCIGCGICIPHCNVNAISMTDENKAVIDNDICVECWVCYRNDICPTDAIETTPLETFEDNFKHLMSDPVETTAETGVPGRGTEESKTNDVTGRTKKGEVGIAVDMGRPGVGCYMYDVEKVAMALAGAGVKLADENQTPLAKLMTNLETGKLNGKYLNIHVLSIIIEGNCSVEDFPKILQAIREVEGDIDTVFSLGVISRVDADGNTTVLDMVEESGFTRPERGKVNVGLGRPLNLD